MLNSLISWSIARRWVVLLIAVALVLGGLANLQHVSLDVFPNFAPPQVTIQTEAPGLAPQEVEALVTIPLESALNGTPGVTTVRSSSTVGLSVIRIIFVWSMDVYRARQLVTEKVQQVAPRLPRGVAAPALLPISSPISDIVKYALIINPAAKVKNRTTLMDLTTIANWQIRNRLLAVPGVTRVLVVGGEVKRYHVLVRPSSLKQYGITLDQVVLATQGANLNAPGGFIITPDEEYLIRTVGRIKSIDELSQSVIAARDGVPVRLRDVADIELGPEIKRGDGSYDGGEAVIVTVSKQPDADTPTVTRAVEAAMKELSATLPKDVLVSTTFKQQEFINASVNNVLQALRDGALVVALIVIFFLGNWRTILITLTALPLSVLLGVIMLNALGVGMNTMTLGGLAIALGEVIDDAIVDTENVYRRLRENAQKEHKEPVAQVIYNACVQVRGSVVFATLILCVVVAPVFALSGVERQIFTPLGLAYVFSIIASLAVALSVTPALCSLLLSGEQHGNHETMLVRMLKHVYKPILQFSIDHPYPVLLSSLIAVLSSLAIVPTLGTTFLPPFQERSLVVHVTQMPGASLQSTQQLGIALEKALKHYPEIGSAQFRAGRAIGDDDAAGVNYGELDVQVSKVATRQKVLEIIRDELKALPGVQANVQGFITERIDEVLSGTRSALAIKVFGPDLDQLRSIALTIQESIKDIPGVTDLQVEPQMPVKQLEVRVDREAASRYGISVSSLASTVETAFNGRPVSQILEGQQLFDLVVWLTPEERQHPETIANLLLDTPSGQKIPVAQVAQLRFIKGPSLINRENVSRRILVSANAAGRDIGSLVAAVQKAISADVQLPPGYYIQYSGQFEAQRQATREILLYGFISLLVVTLLLYSAVKSVRATVIILTNLPLALTGGIVAVALSGGVLSVASLIGFITLFGIANRNGIILVTTYNQLLEQRRPLRDVLITASSERLSPVLMTAMTAGLAMLPLIVSSGAGSEILQPLANVILGGLFTSTLLTLVVIPALFAKFGAPAPGATQPPLDAK